MKILVIAPHMDDEALGCAGAICRHRRIGDEVSVIFIAHRVYSHRYNKKKNETEKSHALKAKKFLGYQEAIFLDLPDEQLDASVQNIIIPIEKYLNSIKPDIVYLPFRGDNHQDHRAVFDAARVALRPQATPFVKSIYMYEIPSSTEQSPPLLENAYLPNHYVDISSFIDRKIDAVLCYRTERRRFPHPRSPEAVRLLAEKRGSESGFRFSEAFMVLRSRW